MPVIKNGSVVIMYCFLFCCPYSAMADFDAAMNRYLAKDYANAMNEARQASAGGDARAQYLLGMMYQRGQGVPSNPAEAATLYEKAVQGGVVSALSRLAEIYMRGEGVPKDMEKAMMYARRSSQFDDPEGMMLQYIILKFNYLSYIGANQKPDSKKYWELAKRPLSERILDTEAQDALYRAVDTEFPLGILSLAIHYGGTVGDMNLERMLTLAGKIPNHTNSTLQGYEKVGRYMKTLGQSLTSPKLFLDAQLSVRLAALNQTCGLQGDNKSQTIISGISIVRPLSGAVYLPSTLPEYARTYLLAGEWEENWTYKGCNKTATIPVKFVADGLGGASFTTRILQTGSKE